MLVQTRTYDSSGIGLALTQNNQDQTIENTEEQTTQTADSSLPTLTSLVPEKKRSSKDWKQGQ